MGEKLKVPAVSALPALTIPPRETFFGGGNMSYFSPGPITLVSSYFSESEHPSFSQLLAGAMASPLAKPLLTKEEEANCKEGNLGYKQNRPMSLMVAHSPFFTPFSPSGLLNSPAFLSPLQSPFGMSHQQALAHVTAQAALSQSYLQGTSAQVLGTSDLDESSLQPQLDTMPSDQQIKKFELPQISQSEEKPYLNSVDKPASDGYNWRKYGQKMVKASECPRSYYKCTHVKCPVRKKVERSVDGHVTEITYKGHHNHELPQPNKRRRDSGAQDGSDCSKANPEIETHTEIETSGLNGAHLAHSEQVSTERASEPPVLKDYDEIVDTATATGKEQDDESNVKRMKTTVETPILFSSHKAESESKIVVQTRSEVDILDDGFKWRKYGQKVVKGNHHPRSYYRCTYPGCNVRKHVERASTDPKAVITTYEGKHNHESPIARNRSHSAAQDSTCQLNEQEIATWRPSLHEKVALHANEIPVCRQLKDEHMAA
ncbi:putative WRKY transcription factor 58 [Capsicum annuum]|uniref:WRKY transcription factor 58 n=1 Tax=Capsicum annuum TaxID=4072 RepID=A0A1U8GP76_CAPAN|nr:probable WRKY transcription factor 4 [Capsicum annuum]KAF3628812.1 putative WRKY transcription factor 58 [Capsicum annuum]KAF3655390.1 putative WRKY transcription factor 58 [Capsicum annuum]PHT83597.1 putative WRKY transcription factor 58 [Capsicum annuum]